MIDVEPIAANMILETMVTAGLHPDEYAILFHVKDNRLSFNFTNDTYYAKKHQGLLVLDETGEINVAVISGYNNGQPGIIIKEKL